MSFGNIILTIDNWLWATPLIVLVFGTAIAYCIAMKFGNVTKSKLQWKLLTSGGGSKEGISPFETFCSVAAWRSATLAASWSQSCTAARALHSGCSSPRW